MNSCQLKYPLEPNGSSQKFLTTLMAANHEGKVSDDLDINILDRYDVHEAQVFKCLKYCPFLEVQKCNLGNLNIVHINIRSLNKNFNNLITFLELSSVPFDIVILSETNTIQNTNQFCLPNYKIFYN